MKKNIIFIAMMLAAAITSSCSWESTGRESPARRKSIRLQCNIEPATRHSLTGFLNEDAIGVYVVNHEGQTPGSLLQTGNQADNARYIYDSARGVWEAEEVCWKDLSTPADIYAYHPYAVPDNVHAYAVSVPTAQDSTWTDSDMLWGHAAAVAPQAEPVPVTFVHVFSKVELHVNTSAVGENVSVRVTMPGLHTHAAVDLATGKVTADTTGAAQAVSMMNRCPDFEAIVIPQSIRATDVLFDICAGGKNYVCQRAVTFVSGKVYRFEMNLQTSSVSLSLNQIQDWQPNGGVIREDLVWSSGTAGGNELLPALDDDRAVLMELFRRTGGSGWKNSDNWGTSADLSTWKGVSVTADGRVRILNLSGNQLSGQIPGCLGKLTELTSLQLYNNQLIGSIPDSLCQLKKLTTLGLYKNQLTGSIPDSIGQLSRLTTLNLYQNQLTGPIDAVTSLITLNDLNLHENAFSGSIPENIGQLDRLRTLNLSGNQFSGNIPESVSQLTHLTTLNLSQNNLTGNIPAGIALIETIRSLIVSGNRLSGTIPEAITAHSAWDAWNAESNITPQQTGYGLIVP